jgi:hypothetical protein
MASVFFSINDFKPLIIKRYSVKPNPGGLQFGFLYYWGLPNSLPIVEAGKIKKEIK